MGKAKRIRGLDCSASADKMIRLVLQAQLKAMCSLRKEALNWKDPEGVHDMRVLSRRLRSAISDFKPFLRNSNLPRLGLRAIARSLGAVRDEDVALAALEALKSDAKESVADGIEILANEYRERRHKARAALKVTLKALALSQFRKEFLSGLKRKPVRSAKKTTRQVKNLPKTFNRFGVEVINARLQEFNAASRHIYSPFDINELHAMRILAKRLRYAMELFAVCWGEEMATMAKQVSFMQTSLGELHDCDVWLERLGARLRQTAQRDDKEIRLLRESAVWLVRHFARQRMEHYRDALALWQQWEAERFIERLKTMLAQSAVPDRA